MTSDYDVIIIGGGTIGLSAAYYAASAKQKVLLIEQFPLRNDVNSSSGYSRFFRMMYSEKNMAQMAETSYALWNQLERLTGSVMVEEMPLLFYGTKNSGDTVEGDFKNTDKIMDQLGMPYDLLDRTQLLKKFPVFKDVPADYTGLLQLNSGVIHVQKSLEVFHKLAVSKGAQILENTRAQIEEAEPGTKTFKVRTDKGDFKASSLILAPGAWTNELIAPLGIQFAFKIWQMTLAYFKLQDPGIEHPFWYEFGPTVDNQSSLFYGFPQREDPTRIKVSADFTYNIYDKVADCDRKSDPKILKLLEEFMAKRFKNVIPKAEKDATCLYTMSSDYHMILGHLPGYSNISILTGESGRAFKFTPLFGRILAELVREGGTSYCLEGISADREGLLCRN